MQKFECNIQLKAPREDLTSFGALDLTDPDPDPPESFTALPPPLLLLLLLSAGEGEDTSRSTLDLLAVSIICLVAWPREGGGRGRRGHCR
jgi:hypothetical protein